MKSNHMLWDLYAIVQYSIDIVWDLNAMVYVVKCTLELTVGIV